MRSRCKAIALFVMLLIVLSNFPLSARTESDKKTLVQDNSVFALDLYRELRTSDGNIFFSPYSISTALAMTYAGARGETEKQMAKAMHFSLSQDKLHPAFSNLQDKLKKVQKKGNVQLHVANSLWPHKEYPFRKEFLRLVKKNYKTEITAVDYVRQTEKARKTINAWVEDKTRDKIKELIKPGVLNALTRLVLVNAIYFKGDWASQFDKKSTREMLFKLSPDKAVKTPMMYQKGQFGYWADKDLQVLEMPYVGKQLSMVVLVPTRIDGLPQLEEELNVENLRRWTSQLRKRKVDTWLPKFKLECDFRLDKVLQAMGMVDAFTSNADLSGMDGTDWLYISAALHKAFVDVNEEGTEAAAATAVVSRAICMDPQFRADHPFVFLIQENQTGSILFIGRMTDPTKTGETEKGKDEEEQERIRKGKNKAEQRAKGLIEFEGKWIKPEQKEQILKDRKKRAAEKEEEQEKIRKEKTKEEAKKREPLPAVSKRDTVTISVEIIFEDYEKAPIIVSAASEGHMGPPDIASVEIPKPGKYALKVPANAGNINLSTMNKQLKDRPMPETLVGEYEENPLKVGSLNIGGIDIRITKEFQPKVKTYEGPTITISGEVMVEGYERGGRIIVAAWSGDYEGPPPITGKELPGPGKYALKVPANAGSIRVTAMYVPAEDVKKLEPEKPSAGAYEKNPLKVGSSNIGGINIVISGKRWW